jgi:uncharacterized protein YuzE
MRIQYDADADVLTLVLRSAPPVDAIEEPGGLVISYGDDNELVSVEFLRASQRGFWKPGQNNITLEPAQSDRA